MESGAKAANSGVSEFGYQQEFSRTLRRFSSFAIGFSFISITTGIFTTYGSVLISSGPLGIWTWPLVIVGQLMVALIFGALASRIPLAGYSYQWMSRLANPQIGWLMGWFVFAFLVVDAVAVDYALASTVLPALLNYTGTAGNTWLATAVIVLVQAILIALSTVWVQRINNTAVGTELIGIAGLTILLLVVGAIVGHLHWGHLFSTAAVSRVGYFGLGEVNHDSPWVLGFLLGAFTIVGFEACGNLSEETDSPEKTVPRAMWTSVVLSGALGFVFLIAITAASANLHALSASSTPVADIVTGMLGGAVGKLFLVFVTFSIFACGMVIFVTCTRVTWAMARDERFPGWSALRHVDKRYNTPLLATVVVGILIEVVLAVFANQTSALFELFSAASLMPALIYLFTVILYLARRRRLPAGRGFELGRWEWLIVTVAIVWLLFDVSIFRDASFATPWLYVAVMTALGLVYFAWMLLTHHSLDMPTGETIEQAVAAGDL
jgi:amino acid transporter